MSGGTVTKTGGGVVSISSGTGGTGTINQSGGVFTNTTSATFLGESWNGDGNGTWNLTGGDAVATKFFGMMKRSQEERLPYGWERCAPSTTKREELVSGGNG